MNVIFLDFDGVLNNRSSDFYYLHVIEGGQRQIAAPDPICVGLIDHLIERTNAYVVISSSWRMGYSVDELKDILRDSFGMKNYDRVISKTRNNDIGDSRGKQIDMWMTSWPEKIDNYVILDDNSDMMKKHKLHFVQTNQTYGFTVDDLKKALSIFSLELIPPPVVDRDVSRLDSPSI